MHTPTLSTPDPATDAALMGRMARRDATALVELRQRHFGSLYAQVYGILMDAKRAERVVEEVFEQVWYRAAWMSERRTGALGWLRDLARVLAHADRAAGPLQTAVAARQYLKEAS